MIKAVVLLSGGLDSATTLAIARSKGFECFALTVAYGQRHESELRAAARVADALGAAEHRIMHVDMASIGGSALTDRAIAVPEHPTEGIPITYVPARNTIMLSLAMAWAEVLSAEVIFIGVNARDYSVGGDTKVWVRARKEARLMSIKSFCELPEDDYETVAVDPDKLELQWRRVTGRFAHKIGRKRCYRVTLERGQRIDVSEDHSLFTIGDYGQIVPIRGAQLDIGTPLVVPFDLCDVRDSWEVDLATIDLRRLDRCSASPPPTTLHEESGRLTNRLRLTQVPLDFPLTDEFLRIVGLWLAEGGKDPESANKNLAFSVGGLHGAPRLLREYFAEYNVGVNKSPANDFDYCISSSVFHEVFRRLGLFGTAKAGTKRFPSWYWQLSQRQRRIVVAGLWDGDGCCVWNGEAAISQKSHEILHALYHCLLLDGIFATIKPARHSQLRLAITRSTDMTRFVSLYPLWHATKRQSLIQARSARGKDKTTGLWKFAGLWQAVSTATLSPGLKQRIYNRGGKYDGGVRAQRSAFAPVPMLTSLVDSKLAFLRVKSIEPVQHDVMYDLSVEGAENFLANGFVAHNSGYPDCRPEFIHAFNELASRATKAGVEGNPTRIEAPLIERSKAEIIRSGAALGVEYSLTVSCYQADDEGRACGRCDSCRIRRDGFIEAGIDDPTRYR